MSLTYSQFEDLPASQKRYLVQLTARLASDPTTTVELYLSDRQQAFPDADDPYYKPLIAEIPRLRRSCQAVFKDSSENRWGSLKVKRQKYILKPESSNDPLAIDWLDPDQTIHIDNILSGEWLIKGSALTILYGGEDLPISEYRYYLQNGVIRGIDSFNETEISIDIADESAMLSDVFVNPNTIVAGTNVPDSSVGKAKPFGLGNVKNASPVLIEQLAYTYLFHDTSVLPANSLDAVYDTGVELTISTDYTVDLANGTFTLIDKPVGVVTCDFKGAKFATVYQDRPGAIIKGLTKSVFGKADADLDLSAFTAFATAFDYECGLYLSEKTSLRKAFDSLLSGLPAFFDFADSGFGVWEFGEITGTPDIAITDRNLSFGSIKYDPEIVYRITVSYDRNNTAIPENQSASSLTMAQKTWFAADFRKSVVSDDAIKVLYPDAVELDKKTCLISKSDAEAVATKLLNLKKIQRQSISAEYMPLNLSISTAMLVQVTDTTDFPRYGLEAGRLYRITELQHKDNAVTLTLWG